MDGKSEEGALLERLQYQLDIRTWCVRGRLVRHAVLRSDGFNS